MEIKQKRFSHSSLFEFRNDDLKFTGKDESGAYSFSLKYASIPSDSSELIERNGWFRNVGILWVLIGVLQIALHYRDSGGFGGGFWFLAGIICLTLYATAKNKYTVFTTDKGRIYILKDKQHDDIINEISSRRKGQLLSWYGELNYSNDPNAELEKFRWLMHEGAIGEVEYTRILAKLTNYHQRNALESAPSHNETLN